MATIELGEISASPLVETEQSTPRIRPPSRGLRVGVLLLLLLLTMAAAAVQPRPLPEVTVPARLGAAAFVAGDRLLVADPVNVRIGEQWLTAYRISDGERLWRVPMPLRGNAGPQTVVGTTLLFNAEWGAVIPAETVAVDLATGIERWRRLAWLDGVTTDGDALLWTSKFDDWADAAERPGTLRAVSVDTGSERWSLPLPPSTVRDYQYDYTGAGQGEARVRQLVVVLPSGEIEARDVATGRLARSTRIPPPGVDRDRRNVDVVGDLILVHDDQPDVIVAYSWDSPSPLWTITPDPDPGEYGPLPCGICSASTAWRAGCGRWTRVPVASSGRNTGGGVRCWRSATGSSR